MIDLSLTLTVHAIPKCPPSLHSGFGLFESRVPGLFIIVIGLKLHLLPLQDLGGPSLERVAMLLFVGNLRFEHISVKFRFILCDDAEIDIRPRAQIIHNPA